MTTIQMDPSKVDQAVSQFEEDDLPSIKELDGFNGFTLFVDRSSGKVFGISYWDSKEQMDASEQSVQDSRQRTADTGGADAPPQVEVFEVAIDTYEK
jgi:heme-degrading monooxygenase HmoA